MASRIGITAREPVDSYFNYYLRNARIEAGYTSRELARLVGVSSSAISSYERLRALPPLATAKKLASVLGKKVSELFPKQLRQYAREINRERRGHEVSNSYFPLIRKEEEIPQSENYSPESIAQQNHLRRRLEEVLKTLPYREREIIKSRFDLGEGYSYTLKELGSIFKITKERVRQLEVRAIERLRKKVRSDRLVGFLD
jgi:RNA polymerase sigma factor (sigma-70 family)